MKRYSGYMLIGETNLGTFHQKVLEVLGDGYELYGSPSAVVQGNGILRHFQAVVKYDESLSPEGSHVTGNG